MFFDSEKLLRLVSRYFLLTLLPSICQVNVVFCIPSFLIINKQKLQDYGHIMLKSPKVSNVKPHQYLERLTAWDYHLECAGGIMDNISELLIGKQRLNPRWVHYIHLHANTLKKIRIQLDVP